MVLVISQPRTRKQYRLLIKASGGNRWEFKLDSLLLPLSLISCLMCLAVLAMTPEYHNQSKHVNTITTIVMHSLWKSPGAHLCYVII